ncbi:hypothetical protein B0H14DRAFT_3578357 [Mycena olivaceomarginata]|nr:hypothetical protein B0H14DRAFT_3578357 [Mycena olivaceomarginata]
MGPVVDRATLVSVHIAGQGDAYMHTQRRREPLAMLDAGALDSRLGCGYDSAAVPATHTMLLLGVVPLIATLAARSPAPRRPLIRMPAPITTSLPAAHGVAPPPSHLQCVPRSPPAHSHRGATRPHAPAATRVSGVHLARSHACAAGLRAHIAHDTDPRAASRFFVHIAHATAPPQAHHLALNRTPPAPLAHPRRAVYRSPYTRGSRASPLPSGITARHTYAPQLSTASRSSSSTPHRARHRSPVAVRRVAHPRCTRHRATRRASSLALHTADAPAPQGPRARHRSPYTASPLLCIAHPSRGGALVHTTPAAVLLLRVTARHLSIPLVPAPPSTSGDAVESRGYCASPCAVVLPAARESHLTAQETGWACKPGQHRPMRSPPPAG